MLEYQRKILEKCWNPAWICEMKKCGNPGVQQIWNVIIPRVWNGG